MSVSKLYKVSGKWIAVFGSEQREFDSMKAAAQWLEDCAEKERRKPADG